LPQQDEDHGDCFKAGRYTQRGFCARKGKERKGKERKGKEGKGRERKGKERTKKYRQADRHDGAKEATFGLRRKD